MTKTEIFNNAISVAVLKHHEDISKQSIFVSEIFANHLLDEGQCFKHGDKLLFFRLNITGALYTKVATGTGPSKWQARVS